VATSGTKTPGTQSARYIGPVLQVSTDRGGGQGRHERSKRVKWRALGDRRRPALDRAALARSRRARPQPPRHVAVVPQACAPPPVGRTAPARPPRRRGGRARRGRRAARRPLRTRGGACAVGRPGRPLPTPLLSPRPASRVRPPAQKCPSGEGARRVPSERPSPAQPRRATPRPARARRTAWALRSWADRRRAAIDEESVVQLARDRPLDVLPDVELPCSNGSWPGARVPPVGDRTRGAGLCA
jgi:hypothetical protein